MRPWAGFDSPARHTMSSEAVEVEAQWLAVATRRWIEWDNPRLTKYFAVSASTRLGDEFGVRRALQFPAHNLQPTDGLHRLITRSLPGRTLTVETTRTPYGGIILGDLTGTISSVKAEVFPSGILTARVKAKVSVPWPADTANIFRYLYKLRLPVAVPSVDAVLKTVFALAAANRQANLQEVKYSHYFGMQISTPIGAEALGALVDQYGRELVSLLIGASEPASLGEELVQKILHASDALNEKSRIESMLLNRQGLIYLLPSGAYTGPHADRFQRSMDLATAAHFARAFLEDDQRLLGARPAFAQFLGSRVRQWVRAPHLVFHSTVSNKTTWEALSTALQLSAHLDDWEGRLDPRAIEDTADKLRAIPDNWWMQPGLSYLLEEGGGVGHDPLAFIDDLPLRELVEKDREEAYRCRATGNYRAAVVMAGAAVEGSLLGLLLAKKGEARRQQLLKLGLQELVEECCPKFREQQVKGTVPPPPRLISTETASLIDRSCRAWRNLVHPGVTLRAQGQVRQSAADAAIAALNLLIDDISVGKP